MHQIWKIIEGLQIIAKYGGKDVQAEHDVLYAGVDVKPTSMSEEDNQRLILLGWDWHPPYDCWQKFT